MTKWAKKGDKGAKVRKKVFDNNEKTKVTRAKNAIKIRQKQAKNRQKRRQRRQKSSKINKRKTCFKNGERNGTKKRQ